MKYNLSFLSILLALLFFACNNAKQNNKAENDIDAARNFIRAALDGKFDIARKYLLADSSNNQYLDAVERNYNKMAVEMKTNYRGASINIHLVDPVNDSTTILVYSNSYKNDHDTLKAIKSSKIWQIDLKYLFIYERDSAYNRLLKSDSLK